MAEPATALQLDTLAVGAIVEAYAFVLGASVGSFLNVVAYRLPRGISLLRPASHCPKCQRPVAWRDNVPVLGWLLLRGRCRACRMPISPRYPLVELAVGLVFALLAYPELLCGGANLPTVGEISQGAAHIRSLEGAAIGLWLFHSTLLAALTALALLDADRQTVPWKPTCAALAVGLLLPIVWPALRPVPLLGLAQGGAAYSPWLEGPAGLGWGMALGACLGFAVGGSRVSPHPGWALALVGAYLGWQAVLSVACLCVSWLLVAALCAMITARIQAAPCLAVLVATLVQLLAWRRLASIPWWPGPEAGMREIAWGSAAVVIGSLAVSGLTYTWRRMAR